MAGVVLSPRTLPAPLRFALVGAFGFVVDGGLLQALVAWGGWHPLTARAISLPLAIVATWWCNRRFTFDADVGTLQSLLRYVMVSLGGAGVNLACYTALTLASDTFADWPVAALAIASVLAMGFNYLGSKYFAFRGGFSPPRAAAAPGRRPRR